MKNRYIFPDYANDIDREAFDFQQYGKAVYWPKQTWEEVKRTYLIELNAKENK